MERRLTRSTKAGDVSPAGVRVDILSMSPYLPKAVTKDTLAASKLSADSMKSVGATLPSRPLPATTAPQ